MLRTSRKRLEVLSALAEIEGIDRDQAVNDAIFHWAQDRVEITMERRLKEIFWDK
jgi:hypothetical protein